MNFKVPSSILISLYLALGLTFLHIVWNELADNPGEPQIYRLLLFFLISFVLLVGILEWFVYRKLKSIRLISEREIRKLKELEAYRREFLGEVSHELKTPIFAIQGFIDTLLDGAIDDKRVRIKFLKKAGKNADRLSNLVQDLLTITQAESGEMEVKIRPFPIYELVTEVVDSLYQKFTKKKRNITCKIIDNGLIETEVLADRERIMQVLINLVDNAIKYGDQEGEVCIVLEEQGGRLFVSVTDNGPGIPEEDIGKIFRRFYRVDKSRSRDRGGTGLGLAIVKHFLELHGEKIKVESEIGQGTTFRFGLKIAK
jgi:two-component system phosphate regulon sensor histidine kinase PhoR